MPVTVSPVRAAQDIADRVRKKLDVEEVLIFFKDPHGEPSDENDVFLVFRVSEAHRAERLGAIRTISETVTEVVSRYDYLVQIIPHAVFGDDRFETNVEGRVL